jgi:hypothetical protein
LAGDAAFVVRPHTTMGVAKASGDAMALSSGLSKTPLSEALEAMNASAFRSAPRSPPMEDAWRRGSFRVETQSPVALVTANGGK